MQDKLISRKRECEELQRCLDSDRSELVIISGRRRIGKTYLIDKFFKYKYDFTFVGEHKTPAPDTELHACTPAAVQETPVEGGNMV